MVVAVVAPQCCMPVLLRVRAIKHWRGRGLAAGCLLAAHKWCVSRSECHTPMLWTVGAASAQHPHAAC